MVPEATGGSAAMSGDDERVSAEWKLLVDEAGREPT